jgi:hypothetical protein
MLRPVGKNWVHVISKDTCTAKQPTCSRPANNKQSSSTSFDYNELKEIILHTARTDFARLSALRHLLRQIGKVIHCLFQGRLEVGFEIAS